jgi:hypothetical protein
LEERLVRFRGLLRNGLNLVWSVRIFLRRKVIFKGGKRHQHGRCILLPRLRQIIAGDLCICTFPEAFQGARIIGGLRIEPVIGLAVYGRPVFFFFQGAAPLEDFSAVERFDFGRVAAGETDPADCNEGTL